MSTVQNIIDRVQPRIGTYTDAVMFINFNNAIRTISKRLFVLDSHLIKTAFSLTFSAEETFKYIPTTYSDFWRLMGRPEVVGETDTLKPTPTQNDEYEDKILPYKPDVHDTNQGTLSYSSNDFVDDGQDFSDWSGDNYKIVVTNSDGTLNWGYIGGYATGDVTKANIYQDSSFETAGWLGTDPSAKTPSSYEVQTQDTGTPEYFEMIGLNLHIYPCWGSEDDDLKMIKGFYFPKPTEITDVTDTMPFNEIFDEVIEEYIVKINRTGHSGADDKSLPQLLDKFLIDAVNEIVWKPPKGGNSGGWI